MLRPLSALRSVALLLRTRSTASLWNVSAVLNSYERLTERISPSKRSSLACLSGSAGTEFRVFKDTVRHLPEGDKLTTGTLVEFRKGGDLLLGLVEGQLEQKWVIYDQSGKVQHVRGQDIALVLPGTSYRRPDISAFVEHAAGANVKTVEVTWQLMEATTQPISLQQMAKLLLECDTPMDLYSAYTLLKHDKRYFRQISRDPPLYFRTSPQEVQMLQDQDKTRQQATEVQEVFRSAVAEALTQSYTDRPEAAHWLEGEHRERILALKQFAVAQGPTLETRNLAMESLRVCGMSLTPNGAVRLLESIKVLNKHEPIALLRAGIQTEFPDTLQNSIEEVVSGQLPDPDATLRRDLTHLTVLSIDEAGTREIDDAISVEELPAGHHKVWIHVSDPSRWIQLDSPLDQEARKRVVSLYVPTGAIPVFPWQLAEGCFSLRTETECYALSFGAELDAEGKLESYEVVPSLIRPHRSYSYLEADGHIEQDSDKDLTTLAAISKLRYAWRMAQGAVDIQLPECNIKVDLDSSEEPEVVIKRLEHSTASRDMISEFMILAGEIAGRLGVAQRLALPYRSQAKAVLPKLEEQRRLPKGPCRAAALRRCMTRGVTSSTQALSHAGLGVEAYVQITSPIRRYTDFLAHLQLKAYLHSKTAPLSGTELESVLVMTSRIARERLKAVEACDRYWLAQYFKQQQRETTWTGTLLYWLRETQGVASVLIEELGLETQIRIDRPAKPGDQFRLALAGVDVKSGAFRFEASSLEEKAGDG